VIGILRDDLGGLFMYRSPKDKYTLKAFSTGLRSIIYLLLLLAGLQLAGPLWPNRPPWTVLTRDSWALDKNLIAHFERDAGIMLRFYTGGDCGSIL
jgi:hypothetical protein